MRVLHLSWEYPPVMYGGLGRHVHALAETQAARGDDVVVITQASPGATADEVVAGVRVIRVSPDAPDVGPWQKDFIGWVFGFNVAVTRAAIALLREWRPEVVHGHDWLVAQAAVLVQESAGLPFVLTVHATEAGRQHGELVSDQSRAIHSTEWWGVDHADRVIVCSEYMQWEVEQLFDPPRGSISVIPNGIDPAQWEVSEARRRRTRREVGTPLVVYAGRLEWEKGVQTLIDAAPRLRRRFPALRVVIVGQGGIADDLRHLARTRRLGSTVRFTGWVPEDELRALVASADVAVVPSLYEPFGFVALEAAVLGAPLVVSRTGGLAEIVEDGVTGGEFAPGDVDGLAGALVEALEHPRRSRHRAAALRESVIDRYGWPGIADRTERAYRDALHTAGAGTRAPLRPRVLAEGNLLAGGQAGGPA